MQYSLSDNQKERELLTIAGLLAKLEEERDCLDQAIRTIRAAAAILDRRTGSQTLNLLVPNVEDVKEAKSQPPKKRLNLPPDVREQKWKEARRLFEEENWSHQRVAEFLGCAVTTIYSRKCEEHWIRKPKLEVVS